MNVAVGACSRVASSRLSVPLALTAKSVCGSDAAQSCDGCAAVWMTSSIAARLPGEHALRRRRRRGCRARRAKARRARGSSRSVVVRGRRLGAEEARAHVVLDPDHVDSPARRSERPISEPIRPPEPVIDRRPPSAPAAQLPLRLSEASGAPQLPCPRLECVQASGTVREQIARACGAGASRLASAGARSRDR